MNNSIQTKHTTARNSRGFIKSSKDFYIGDITNVLDPWIVNSKLDRNYLAVLEDLN